MTRAPSALPIPYRDAKRALAALVKVDDVKKIRDKAVALEVYAYQAKDGQLAADAVEYKRRATRRLGELIEEMRAAGKLAKGAREKGTRRGTTRGSENPASLEAQGVDKNLAKRAREDAAMEEFEFEADIAKTREQSIVLAERGDREIAKRVRLEKRTEILDRRRRRHRKIAETAAKRAPAIENAGPFCLIYLDAPWVFECYSRVSATSTPDDHYPTLTDDQIVDYQIGGKTIEEIAHDVVHEREHRTRARRDAASRLPLFITAGVGKERTGTGHIFFNRHEVLLYGVKGSPPKPAVLFPSVFRQLRTEHSAKPPEIRKMIEAMFPDYDARTRIELFARGYIEGWSTDGYEAVA
jgi:hypothetical protein